MAITVGPNTIKFKNRHTIYENEIVCRVSATELNMSQNPTITTDTSGSLRDFATGSIFQPYATTIGIYNEANELCAVAKLSRPLIKDFTKELLVRVKLDY